MRNRGEDASRPPGAWGPQPPWPSPSGSAPEHAGAWDDRSRGYPQDDDYPAGDGGFGYGPAGSYPGSQPEYGQPEYGQPGYQQPGHGQPGHDPYDGYPAGQGDAGQGSADGYGSPAGYGREDYGRQDDYGYERGPAPSAGYGEPTGYREQPGYDQPGYDQGNYEQRPAPGYGGYDRSGAHPAQPGGSGAHPALRGGTGEYPAQDAGNDWYGGQPAAANGASFADTGTYTLNGRIIDEYGTGPRGALRDPVRGYAPAPNPDGTTGSGPNTFVRSGGQERYDDYAPYPGHPQEQPGSGRRRGAPDGGPGGPGGPGDYDDYAGYERNDTSRNDAVYRTPGYDDRGEQPPGPNDDRDRYDDYETAGDPYQERYGTGPRAAKSTRRRPAPAKNGSGSGSSRSLLRSNRMLAAVLVVIAAGIACAAAYVFVLKPKPASNVSGQGPLPTASAGSSQAACATDLGTYCHITDRSDDPVPLTTTELFLPAFTNETDKLSYSLAATETDKKCSNAVIGPDLISELSKGKCTQVLRATYIAGNGKIMGTIGVINLDTDNEAHHAGRVVGTNDFIKPLSAAKGVASKIDNGTGLVESTYKGHYLILTWSLFVSGTKPTTKTENTELDQFSQDLIAGTANISLSQRMVTGGPATSAPSPSATPRAKANR